MKEQEKFGHKVIKNLFLLGTCSLLVLGYAKKKKQKKQSSKAA